jgi:hypothetical protein
MWFNDARDLIMDLVDAQYTKIFFILERAMKQRMYGVGDIQECMGGSLQ